jgi:hypothetical protein
MREPKIREASEIRKKASVIARNLATRRSPSCAFFKAYCYCPEYRFKHQLTICERRGELGDCLQIYHGDLVFCLEKGSSIYKSGPWEETLEKIYNNCDKGSEPSCTISGSFRKFYGGIIETKEEFEKNGIEVISPKKSKITSSKKGFVILESDSILMPGEIEDLHLDAIEDSDFVYIYNPEGYVGYSTRFEIGYALALRKPIFSLELVDDEVLQSYIIVLSPEELCKNWRNLLSAI